MTQSAFIDIAPRLVDRFKAIAKFEHAGEIVDPVSGDGAVELRDDLIVLRIVNDRKQWFVEIRSKENEEWFDARFVIVLVGENVDWVPPANDASLDVLVQQVLTHYSRWKRLFEPFQYDETRRQINELEQKSARKRFGYS